MEAQKELESLTQQTFGISYDDYMRLVRVHDYTDLVTVLEVLKTKQPRAIKRKRAKQAVLDWLHDFKTGRPSYPRPLRPWLYGDLVPKWPTTAIDTVLAQIKQLQYVVLAPTLGSGALRNDGAPCSSEPALVKEIG